MGILTMLLTGPLFGVLGSALNRYLGLLEIKAKHVRDMALRKLDYDQEERLLNIRGAQLNEEREDEMALAQIGADTARIASSYEHDRSGNASQWVIDYLRWVRPVLTILLMALSAVVFFTVADGDTQNQIALTVLFLTEVAVTWWFADRARDSWRAKRGSK